MTRSLAARLTRLERARAPALPQHALCIVGEADADVQHQIAEAVRDGRHVPGWPLIVLTYTSGEITHEP